MRANTKTKTSEGTDKWFDSGNREVRDSSGMLTKGEGEGKLKDYEAFARIGKTYVIWAWGDPRRLCC